VESQNYLGIYISRNTATAVCLGPQKKDGNVLKYFSVSVEGQEQTDMHALAGLIAQGCAERELKFSEITVALDCAMFMQHSVHSEFKDPKQIADTVRFDTEEALATDITNIAVAFEIASSDQNGSQLTVFTSERKVLLEVLDALQQYNLDPVNIEPDVNCLSRFICRHVTSAGSEQTEALYGLLSHRNGYLIVPPAATDEDSRRASIVRTFLVGATQDRAKLLQREVLITTALVEGAGPINYFQVFDSAGAVESNQLGEKLGMETGVIDLRSIAETKLCPEAECADPIDFGIAYGAALAFSEKGRSVDFREDFSPFQGKKLRLQKTLKAAAISVTILLVAVGLYFHTQLFSVNRSKNNIRSRFAKDYAEVTLEQLSVDLKIKDAVRELGKLLRRIEGEKKGLITDEKSISSNLTLLLTAFNKCAAQTNLNIDTITVTTATKNIMITGDTSGRQNTLKFFEVLGKNGLENLKFNFSLKGGRDNFNITVVPKK
jgi:hypothetical protein